MMNNVNQYSFTNPLSNLIHNRICICNHLQDEHLNNKDCYGLDDNDGLWVACDCKKHIPKGLNINLYLYKEIKDENNKKAL